jgi:hypothetical protein
VTLEIRRGGTIFRVHVTANSLLALSLASPVSALKEVVLATLIVSDRNLCLKKTIDGRTPVGLETLYN